MKWKIKIVISDSGSVKFLHGEEEILIYDSPEAAADAMHYWIGPQRADLDTERKERYYVLVNGFFRDIEIVPA